MGDLAVEHGKVATTAEIYLLSRASSDARPRFMSLPKVHSRNGRGILLAPRSFSMSPQRTGFTATLIGCALLANLGPSVADAQTVSLQVRGGRVTLSAEQVPISEILRRWAEEAGVTFVNGQQLQTVVSLQLDNVPETTALQMLLRGASGYVLVSRENPSDGQSLIGRIVILPTSSRPAASPVQFSDTSIAPVPVGASSDTSSSAVIQNPVVAASPNAGSSAAAAPPVLTALAPGSLGAPAAAVSEADLGLRDGEVFSMIPNGATSIPTTRRAVQDVGSNTSAAAAFGSITRVERGLNPTGQQGGAVPGVPVDPSIPPTLRELGVSTPAAVIPGKK